ncbi:MULTISPECIES: RidA family protein [unclassified Microbacterium]|uniref:RidA family protein n=1 Tax=unclassified Microbacterium TaxID=2609290 RepID=UPI001604C8C6|nr:MULTISPECIES: RidA family protein [unclassified Microbacterium]QNA93774.1 RidA family protein [Microbacterium sp. Se63.02b]QYM64070.1 RidA family protein [Microbacterium sp. Se5.02b]
MIDHFGAHPDRVLSRSVRAGDWLYVSGQASTDPETGAFVPGTFDEEFRRSVENLDRALAEAGADRGALVRLGVFVRDEDALPRYNELYLQTFAHPRPARTTIAMGFGFLQFEIEAVAYLGD